MVRIFLVRHGETLSNVWKIMQGWSDTPLTEKGIQQGIDLSLLLKDLNVSSIYSSTSERAYDTACLINRFHHNNIQMTKGLKELNFGSFETQSEYVLGGCQKYIMTFDWTKYGGENVEILMQRVGKTLCTIVDNAKENDNIICVTHSIAILAALRYVDEKVYEYRMRQNQFIDNCSVTIIDYDGRRFRIGAINTKSKEKIYMQ